MCKTYCRGGGKRNDRVNCLGNVKEIGRFEDPYRRKILIYFFK
jgi:hypothetical protein